jgi:hypothetical protein
MLLYALIGLCLVLVGVAGLQFSYLFYADRLQAERRKHLERLERRCAELTARLDAADDLIAEQASRLESYGLRSDDEAWADVIEER